MKKLILASGSPRRHAILSDAGIPHIVIPTNAPEDLPDGISPREAVMLLSRRKAEAMVCPEDSIILAADTVVAIDEAILGKPENPEEAAAMLAALSGKAHSVYTGFTLTDGVKTVTDAARTKVVFRELSREEILSYVATGEPLDKAGAYGIQGMGSRFVSSIRGEYFNVVGLPICQVGAVLTDRFGFCLPWGNPDKKSE